MKDLIGEKFHKLTIIENKGIDKDGHTNYLFRCDCGNETKVALTLVKNGHTKSCGCMKYESKNIKHGKCSSRIYRIWSSMLTRCHNENSKSYKYYGEKGIKVCERWHNFDNFYEDTKNNYSDELSLDRYPNNNGNYEPNNFRWATTTEQQINKNRTKLYNYNGELLCIPEISKKSGISKYTMYSRVAKGLPPEKTIYKVNRK